jgi:hypothetical protein
MNRLQPKGLMVQAVERQRTGTALVESAEPPNTENRVRRDTHGLFLSKISHFNQSNNTESDSLLRKFDLSNHDGKTPTPRRSLFEAQNQYRDT